MDPCSPPSYASHPPMRAYHGVPSVSADRFRCALLSLVRDTFVGRGEPGTSPQRIAHLIHLVPPESMNGAYLDCSLPRNQATFVRPEFAWAPIAQRLVRAHLVVPVDPRAQLAPGVLEAGEVMLPDTFLLHAAEEALDDPVLLRRVGGCCGGPHSPKSNCRSFDCRRRSLCHLLSLVPAPGATTRPAEATAGTHVRGRISSRRASASSVSIPP